MKLDAQSRPSSDPFAYPAARFHLLLFGASALASIWAGRWAAAGLAASRYSGPTVLLVGIVIVAAIALCWRIAKAGGWRVLGCTVFAVVAFCGSTLFHLLLAIRT